MGETRKPRMKYQPIGTVMTKHSDKTYTLYIKVPESKLINNAAVYLAELLYQEKTKTPPR